MEYFPFYRYMRNIKTGVEDFETSDSLVLAFHLNTMIFRNLNQTSIVLKNHSLLQSI